MEVSHDEGVGDFGPVVGEVAPRAGAVYPVVVEGSEVRGVEEEAEEEGKGAAAEAWASASVPAFAKASAGKEAVETFHGETILGGEKIQGGIKSIRLYHRKGRFVTLFWGKFGKKVLKTDRHYAVPKLGC